MTSIVVAMEERSGTKVEGEEEEEGEGEGGLRTTLVSLSWLENCFSRLLPWQREQWLVQLLTDVRIDTNNRGSPIVQYLHGAIVYTVLEHV